MTIFLAIALLAPAFAEDGDGDIDIRPTQDSPENDDDFTFDAEVEVWQETWEADDSVWGDTYETPVGDFSWDVLGYDASATASAGFDDNGLEAELSAEARAYLAQVGYEIDGQWGSEETHLGGSAEADAYVGADIAGRAELDIGLDGVELEVGVEAFAGAKAEAEVGGDLAVCDIGLGGTAGGEASAGIGGTAEAEVEADWSNLEFGVSTELAGTLGLGLGGEAGVTVDLGGLTDPAGTADCVWDGAFEAGRAVVNTGDDIWDAGWEVGSDILGGIGGLFGGGDDDKLSGTIVAVAEEVKRQEAAREARQGNDVVRNLDGALSPRHGRPGMCL